MNTIKRLIITAVIIVPILICGHATGGKLYKWVDKDGVVHFSDRKPEDPEKLKGQVQENEVKDIIPVKIEQAPKKETKTINPVEHTTNCTFTIRGNKSLGTGFFISPNGYAVNLSFDPHTLDSEKGELILCSLLKGFFNSGGMELQLNVLDHQILEDAMAHPGKHPGIVVRVAGYCAYFDDLPLEAKQEIISRNRQQVA